MKEHIKWVDCVKVEACILVVIGHFYQSMVVSGILPDNTIYNWFINTIYCFHVQLFFICSGFLYQKYSKVNNMSTWIKNIKKKLLSLGIPYLIFTTATWMLKHVFSGAVNNGLQTGLAETIFLKPTAPYWYLYALFFIFLITPTFSNTKIAVCYLIGAIIGKFFFLDKGKRMNTKMVKRTFIILLGQSFFSWDCHHIVYWLVTPPLTGWKSNAVRLLPTAKNSRTI